jgi:putative transposase
LGAHLLVPTPRLPCARPASLDPAEGSAGVRARGLSCRMAWTRFHFLAPSPLWTDEEALTADIIALASQYGRYGYRRITALLRDAGWVVNVKRVERIWRREGLKVPQKQPKRGRLWFNDGSCIRLRPERPEPCLVLRLCREPDP